MGVLSHVCFFFYDFISHPSFHSRHIIRFVEVLYAYLTLCLHGLIVFGDWQGSALRLPGGRLRLAKALLCQGLAMELPRNCREISEQAPCDSRGIASRNCQGVAYGRWIALGSKGVALGLCRDILGAFSVDCQGVMNRSNIRKYHGFRQRKFWICFAF